MEKKSRWRSHEFGVKPPPLAVDSRIQEISLLAIKHDLFLYDVPSTYFEGEHEGSELCKRGYSRDNRPDCKQVCIAPA
jgi:hypothetical protein